MYYNKYEIEMMHNAKREDQLRESFINNKIKENRMLHIKNIAKTSPATFHFLKSFSLTNLVSTHKNHRIKIKLAKN